MRKMILLIVAALSLTGCGAALVATGDAMPNPMDVFVFQERCSQESQGDG